MATAEPRSGSRGPPWVARTRITSARLRSARRVSIGSQAYLPSPTSVPRNGGKLAFEADDGPQEEVRLKVFHSKEESDVRLPRAQGSFIATCVRTPKDAPAVWFRPRRRSARWPDCWDKKCGLSEVPGGGRGEGSSTPTNISTWMTPDVDDFEAVPDRNAAVLTCDPEYI